MNRKERVIKREVNLSSANIESNLKVITVYYNKNMLIYIFFSNT